MTAPISKRHRDLPAPPSRGTSAGHAYFKVASSDFRLFHFIIDSVLVGDWVSYVTDQALGGKEEYKDLDPAKLATANPGSRTRFLRTQRQILLEMFVSRLVDNFQSYLVDLIRLVLRSRPTMLSTSQQSLTLEELLKYGSIEELVHDVIERKVNSLSYEGFTELHAWCADRGIIAHNRGIVDERYVRIVGSPRFALGAHRALEMDDLFDALGILHRVVFETDEAAIQTFGLSSTTMVEEKRGHEPEASDEARPSTPAAPLGRRTRRTTRCRGRAVDGAPLNAGVRLQSWASFDEGSS